jgi:hypothetical protein
MTEEVCEYPFLCNLHINKKDNKFGKADKDEAN